MHCSPAPIAITFTWYHVLFFPPVQCTVLLLLFPLRSRGITFSLFPSSGSFSSVRCFCAPIAWYVSIHVYDSISISTTLFSLLYGLLTSGICFSCPSVSRVGCSPMVSHSLFSPPLAPSIQCTVFLLLFLLHSHGIMSIFSPPLAPLVQCTVLLFL